MWKFVWFCGIFLVFTKSSAVAQDDNATVIDIVITSTEPPIETTLPSLIPEEMWSLGTVQNKTYWSESLIPRNWTEVKDYCTAAGLRPATITSRAQMSFLKSTFDSTNFNGEYWLGARDAFTWRQFSWDRTNSRVSSVILGILAHYSLYPYKWCLALEKKASGDQIAIDLCELRKRTLCESR